jgi:FkbM family methyltransferase
MTDRATAADERQPPAGGQRLVTLPNGMTIACQTKTEAGFLYEDIWEKRAYTRHGVSLDGVESVFDVGANIGLFTLFVRRFCPRATVWAFEPAPPLFAILEANTLAHGDRVRRFNCGISKQPGTAELTFYSNSSAMSSFYADLEEEKEVLKAIMVNQLRQGMEGMEDVLRHSDDLLAERFRSHVFRCELKTLSQVIREQRVDRIDLLKVDVQKSERDVVEGIEPDDWGRIRQVVLEVHDIGGRLEQLTDLLRGHGFLVTAEQDDFYEESVIYNLYCIRPGASAGASAGRLRAVGDRAARLRGAVERQRGEAPFEVQGHE